MCVGGWGWCERCGGPHLKVWGRDKVATCRDVHVDMHAHVDMHMDGSSWADAAGACVAVAGRESTATATAEATHRHDDRRGVPGLRA